MSSKEKEGQVSEKEIMALVPNSERQQLTNLMLWCPLLAQGPRDRAWLDPFGDPPLDPINWITARQCVDPAVFARQEGEYGEELEVKDHYHGKSLCKSKTKISGIQHFLFFTTFFFLTLFRTFLLPSCLLLNRLCTKGQRRPCCFETQYPYWYFTNEICTDPIINKCFSLS